MGLAFPLGLMAAALAGPLILLYVLKLRRREVIVASSLPWRRVLEDRRANSPWERLRRNLLLLLQLIVLLLLVLALAGPFVVAETQLTGDTVLVLDASASMGATLPGTSRTRMDEAREIVREALLSVEGGRRAALVVAGPEPRVAAPLSGERAPLAAALARVQLTEAPADLASALELASSLAQGGAGGEVVLITDGAFDPTPAIRAALQGVRVLRVPRMTHAAPDATPDAAPGANAGITSLALRPVAGEAGWQELFVGLHAAGGSGRAVELIVESADPGPLTDRLPDPAGWAWHPVTSQALVPEAGAASHLVRVAAGGGRVLRVRLSGADALRADDEALIVVPERRTRRILLSSPRPFLLQRALGAMPSVEVDVTADEPGSGEGYDAVVVEGPLPEILPQRPLLSFGAPQGPSRRVETPQILRWQARHPALRHARLDAVRVASAFSGALPPGADVLVESDAGPLAVTWPAPGGRALAFRFDLIDSDLPLRVTFPVVVTDAIDWLTEGAEPEGVLPTGRPLELALPGATSAELLLPDGSRRSLVARSGALQVPAPAGTGLALVRPDAGPARLLALALLSPEETDLSARGLEGISAETPRAEGGARSQAGRRPLWPLAAALAMGVLLAEWAVHHRRRE